MTQKTKDFILIIAMAFPVPITLIIMLSQGGA
jgi:hypothetical protein